MEISHNETFPCDSYPEQNSRCKMSACAFTNLIYLESACALFGIFYEYDNENLASVLNLTALRVQFTLEFT